jgi:hypothetical protein
MVETAEISDAEARQLHIANGTWSTEDDQERYSYDDE